MKKVTRKMIKMWTLANWMMTAGEVTVVTAIVLGMDVRPPSQHSELTPRRISSSVIVSAHICMLGII